MANTNKEASKSSVPKNAPRKQRAPGAGTAAAGKKTGTQQKRQPKKDLMQGLSDSAAGKQQRRYYNSLKSNARKGAAAGKRKKPAVPLKIAFLGGLNEIGKNMTLYECGNDMLLVDCGLEFPDPEMLGVD